MMQCNNVCAKLLVARVGQPCTRGLLSTEGLYIWEAGRDVCRDGTFFIPGLHENVSTRDDFTRDNLQSQHNIVPAKRDGAFI